MNTSTTTPDPPAESAADRAAEIERYLAGVAAALADLPEHVRQELLEDLPDHLAEIAADDPASLDSRLGPPPAYAAELRAAVGIDTARPGHRADRWADAVAAVRPHARTLDEQVGRLIGYDRFVDFLVQLRPAWWILRGYLVGMVLLYLFADLYGVFPQDSSAGLLGWPLVLVLVGVSIRLGRRPLHLVRELRPRWVFVGAVVVIFAAWSLTLIDGDDEYYGPPATGGVTYESEVYVYTESGQPVTNVRVYNRGGEAVPIGVPMGCDQPGYGYYGERRGCLPSAEDGPEPEESTEESTEPGPGLSPSQ